MVIQCKQSSVSTAVCIEIFAPFYFCFFRPCCQRADLKLSEFPCLKSFLFNTTLSWRIQGGAKLFTSVTGRQVHGAKIILYTILGNLRIHDICSIGNI